MPFTSTFSTIDKKCYDDGSQFANSFALFLGIVPEKEKKAVLDNLIDDIQITHEGHLTTGILGTKYLMELLSVEGRSDVAWRTCHPELHIRAGSICLKTGIHCLSTGLKKG